MATLKTSRPIFYGSPNEDIVACIMFGLYDVILYNNEL